MANSGFRGSSVREARVLHGLDQKQLAASVGVTAQYLGDLERGTHASPSEELVLRLAQELDVLANFFYRTTEQAAGLHFRARARLARKHNDACLATNRLLRDLTSELTRFVHLRPPNLPARRDAEPEELATACRELWGIQPKAPIDNVAMLLEFHGVVTFRPRFVPIQVQAWCDSGAPPIVVVAGGGTADRQRLTMAHELGHFMQHPFTAVLSRAHEQEAYEFGTNLLFPRAAFMEEFPALRKRFDWQELLALKRRWGMSLQAMLYRARGLGVIDEARYRQAARYVSARGWRQNEPGDCEPEKPRFVQRALDAIGPAKRRELLEELGWTLPFAESMSGCVWEAAQEEPALKLL